MKQAAWMSLCLVVTTVGAGAADCAIDGDAAIRVASGHEFSHSVESEGGTECFRSDDSIIASASSDEAISCDVSLFAGGTFHPDWSLRRAELLGPVTDFERQPSGEINFRLGAEAGETSVATLKSVTLSGPDCDNWEKAFAGPLDEEADDEEADSDE